MSRERPASGGRPGERSPSQRRGSRERQWWAAVANRAAAAARPVSVVTVTALLVVAALSGAGVLVGSASAATGVSECRQISEPGTYELTTDITDATQSACIVVSASDVVLDGQGYTVDGVDEFETAGIVVGSRSGEPLTNVTVRNVAVTDWGTGVAVDSVQGVAVVGVSVSSNRNDGIRVGAGGSTVLLRDVDASENDAGVRVAADDTVLEDVTASRNDGSGVVLGGEAATPTVRGVTANDNGDDGLVVAGLPVDARRSSLRDVTAERNGRSGLDIDRGNVEATGVVAGDNAGWGLNADGAFLTLRNATVTDNGDGVRVRRGSRLENVTVAGHPGSGVEAAGDATLVDATATGNGVDVAASERITLDRLDIGSATLSGTGSAVEITRTASKPADPSGRTNVGSYLDATGESDDSFLDATVRYDAADAEGVDESSLSLWRYDAGEWTEVGGSVDPAADTVTATVTSFGTFAPLGVPAGEEPQPPPSPSSGVNGTVTSADGSPVADASVELVTPETGEVVAATATDAEGRFDLDAPAGTYRLSVAASGFQRTNRTVDVTEGNVTTVDVSLSRVQTRGKVDVVFVLDDTGSMDAEIDGAKRNIRDFTDDLEAKGIDARYALITFKDDVELDQPLTGDPAELKAALERVEAEGGADAREDNFDALKRATELEFRDGVSRVIVDITDQRAHTSETQSRGVTEYTMADVVEFLDGFQAYVAVSDDFRDSFYGTACEDPLGPRCGDKRVLAHENLEVGEWIDLGTVDAEGEDEFGDILDTVEDVVTRVARDPPEPEPDPELPVDSNDPPRAVEGPDLTVRSGETVVLDGSNSTDPDGAVVGYRWESSRLTDLDLPDTDGPTVRFTAPRVPAEQDLVFALTVTDDGGETDTRRLYVTVLPPRERPNFTVTNLSTNSPVTVGGNLTVDATVENVGNATGTQPVELLLNGSHNGTTTVTLGPGNATNATFAWNTSAGDAGRYNATVTTLNGTNATNVTVVDVTVDAVWHSPRRPEAGEPVSFVSNVNVSGTVAAAAWDLDGDGVPEGTGRYATHTFESPGEYAVTLRVNGSDGTRNVTERVTVVAPTSPEPAGPPVEFWMSPRSPEPGETVTLFAEVTDPDATAETFEWDLDGDGSVDATGRTVSVAFREGFDPVLTVELADGRTVDVGSDGGPSGDGTTAEGRSTPGDGVGVPTVAGGPVPTVAGGIGGIGGSGIGGAVPTPVLDGVDLEPGTPTTATEGTAVALDPSGPLGGTGVRSLGSFLAVGSLLALSVRRGFA